jgi:hypothetical protein
MIGMDELNLTPAFLRVERKNGRNGPTYNAFILRSNPMYAMKRGQSATCRVIKVSDQKSVRD